MNTTDSSRISALAGRRIVITRAPQQSEELVRLLEESGAEVLLLPMVQFLEAADTTQLDFSIGKLGAYDWLILTSANAVRFFCKRCRDLGLWPIPDSIRIAAIGDATRDALEEENLTAVLVPRESSGTGLVMELAEHVAGMKVLLPRSDLAGAELPAGLRAAGADVTEVVAYRTVGPPGNAPEQFYESLESMHSERGPKGEAAALKAIGAGDADAITFFSPSAFRHFERLLGAEALVEISARVVFAAIGPVTASAIREAGLRAIVEAPRATSKAIVSALENYFAGRPLQKERSS